LDGRGRLEIVGGTHGADRLAAIAAAHPGLTRITAGAPGGFVTVAAGEPVRSALHPETAERIELWRLRDFHVEHRTSNGDVHLLEVTGRDNPDDHRLVVLAGIAELADAAAPAPAELAETLLEAFAMIRDQRAAVPLRERPLLNRVVVYVRPLWTVRLDGLRGMARRLAPAARDLGIATVVLRARVPGVGGPRDRVVHLSAPSEAGMRLGETALSPRPLRTRSPRQQRLLRLHRRGLRDPYEIVDLMTSRDASSSDFPPGHFREHDLAPDGSLVEVHRAAGGNTAGVVVGVIENTTPAHPEGMARVVLLSDPARGLGALAEPECRRIEAALDLAERLGVPVEWFSVSAGARIAMDSGTENLDWVAYALRRIVRFTQRGGEINVVVAGVNVGAQPYFNAEATMLMHTRGVLIMTPASSMVLTGKEALDFAGSVSADDNIGIGGFDRIMGPNGQAQLWAPTVEGACQLLFDYYERSYVAPGDRFPRRLPTTDPADRDVCASPHPAVPGCDLTTVGDIFSPVHNPERKRPFDMRTLMRAVTDADREPLERWGAMAGAEPAIVWEAHVGGIATTLVGIESRPLHREGIPPADGPQSWSAATLFPRSAKKVARALNAASGRRPVVILANLAGFDGSPESLRELQLEYGAEIGRAVVNFAGPMLFCVVSRYHGGAFVVFSKRLNDELEVIAVAGARASVIGGSAAAAVVFARDVERRVAADPRVTGADLAERGSVAETVRGEARNALAHEFDTVHDIERARRVGSVDRVVPAGALRPEIIAFLAARTAA
ncbi:carboxyl transferase domain-containing protein, partial [Actinophytocola sp.]|uniref:carboxyl transferase domain-containing protein n=1 Tax=Actinophytocola sp. TaxID=1872138 RepID=UPI003D6AE0C4